jgi:LuxR family transcriptional regulator, positive regulator of biofilm formation
MRSSEIQSIGEPVGDAPRMVFVVGSNTLQNELIASTLQDETGLPCLAVEDLSQIEMDGAERGPCLALYDCLGKDGQACLADLKQNGAGQELMLGLFNVEKGEGLEKDALSHGVRGFFYRGEPFSLFVKGVVGIFEGEFWISRQLLSEWVPQQGLPSGRMQQRLLSEREKVILGLLAGGATNKEIADALFISPHTVKNHLQRIFRKINVHSKTQAALWAARYLRS